MRAGRFLDGLSGGQRQRAFIVMVQRRDADHVLDDISMAAAHCDRLLVMNDGRVMLHGIAGQLVAVN